MIRTKLRKKYLEENRFIPKDQATPAEAAVAIKKVVILVRPVLNDFGWRKIMGFLGRLRHVG
jgi:hypothetical protein